MSRKEGDANAFERANHHLIGGTAKGGFNVDLSDIGESFHLVQAASANDAYLHAIHVHSGKLIAREQRVYNTCSTCLLPSFSRM